MPDRSFSWLLGVNIGSNYWFSTSTTCGCTCSVTTAGFFAGTSAERVGLGYHITESTSTPAQVIGAAGFKKN
jgi:hypothetical protein